MNKVYGLKCLHDNDSLWSEAYLFSTDVEKLQSSIPKLPDGVHWYAHRSDASKQVAEKYTITHTTNYDLRDTPKSEGPYYKIVEVPFIT